MNKPSTIVFAGLLVSGSVFAQQSCERPWPVVIPPDAASKEEILALQVSVKQYLKAGEAYLTCNDTAQQSLAPDGATSAQTLRILTGLYNNTVDEMQVVGESFNVLVRRYKQNQADKPTDG
jgi:hypothetical protein